MSSALLELIKETPPEDRKRVAEYLKPYLVPEKEEEPEENWVTIDELRQYVPGNKSKEWIKLFILHDYPETREWSTEPFPGKGRTVKVNLPEARKWIQKHNLEIDWNQSLPS